MTPATDSGLWQVLSRAVDVGTIVISFIDVISDIVVAKQFYDAGHMGWFWAVTASLLLSNVAYTVWCIMAYDFNRCIEKHDFLKRIFGEPIDRGTPGIFLRRVKRFCWLFPVAQLCPTIVYLAYEYQAAHDRKLKIGGTKTPKKKSDDEKNGGGPGASAAAQELEDIADSANIIKAMEESFNAHMQSHALFYIETMVESIPQSVVQLLAVTMLGEASSMQLFSMALSLVSIVSKAYLISISSDLRIFLFKFLLGAHDVFSLFYAFSTILSLQRDHAAPLEIASWFTSEQVLVSDLSAIWGWKVSWQITLALCFFVAGAVIATWCEITRYNVGIVEIMKRTAIVSFFFCVLFIPVMFLAEGFKLTWVIFFLFLLEPYSSSKFSAVLSLRTFCSNGVNTEERTSRIRHVYHQFAKFGLAQVAKPERSYFYSKVKDLPKFRTILRWTLERENDLSLGRLRMKRGTADGRSLAIHEVDHICQEYEIPEVRPSRGVGRKVKGQRGSSAQSVLGGTESTVLPDSTFTDEERGPYLFKAWKPFWEYSVGFTEGFNKWKSSDFEARVVLGCMWGCIAVQFLGCFYSLAFPFLNVYHHPEQQNAFQIFCFGAMCVCLLIASTQLGHVVNFTIFACAVHPVFNHWNPLDLQVVRRWINEYHRPTNNQVLSMLIPANLVNHDLIEHTAKFMTDAALNKKGLSLQDCEQMKKNQ